MMAQLKQIDLINQSLITLHCHLIYFPIFERLLKLFLIIACFDCTVLISGLQIFFNPRIFHLDIVQFYLMLGIDASFETLLVFYLLPLFYHLLRYSSLTYGYVQSHLQQNYIFFLTWLIFRFILDWGIGFLYFYWLIYEFAAQYYQLFMKNNEDQSHNFEVIFLQGIHFYHLNNYYTNLINYLSIFTFIGIDMHIKKTINSTIKSQKNIYQVTSKNLVGRLFVIENRLVRNDLVQYWFVNTLQEFIEGQKNHCQIMIKSEIQMGKNPKDNRNIIKAIIHYSQSIFRFSIFEGFNKLRYKSVLFKDNYCQNYRYNQIVYPYPRINEEYSQNNGNSPIILLLNQNNLRQIPFFQNLLINLSKSGKKIDKIIGHPSSLFLCFLYEENGEINANIAKILLNYDRQPQYRQTFSNKIEKSKIIKGLLLKTLTQQNIINPCLVQFIVDNIVNQQFIQDFITLIQLYYKIFLQTEVSKSQIESMFSNFFYEQQLTIQRQCFKFSSLLHHIEFKHNIWVNQLIKRIIHHLPSKFTQIQQITLKDLYDHCQIEFTFVALDLTDKIVRFFNHITTPKMPIIAILSLIQFLPLPYKSIYWRSQWGPYKVSYPKYRKQIDITNHQIIDSRFLLETPLDLIQDKHLRNCYMQNTNKSYVIRAVSSIRKKAQQLQEIQTLKALLKSMKSNAIDSIPKLRLIWKILTTNNRVQFDINDVQSFSQIPILSRIIKLDQTFKVYLQNINKEVNQDRIIKIPAMLFPQRNINLPIVEQNLRKLIQIINSFIKSQKQGNNNAQQEIKIKQIQFLLEGTRLKYLQQWIYLLNHINNKITNIFLSKNQQIVKKIGQITSEFYHYQQFLDSKQVQMHFRQLITLIKQSKPNKQAMDAPLQSLNSSTFLRDNQFQFQNNAHKIKSLQVIIRSINQQLNSYKYRRNQSSQLLLMQYQKHMFQWSHKLVQIIQKMPQTSSTHKFLVQAFRVTPWIYKITQVKNKKIVHQCTLMSKFQKTNHSLHLILNGQSNTQFQIINLIHRLNNCLGQGKISKITATNFHSVVALLFVINLDQFSIMEEVIGLWHLVAKSTVKNDKKQQNINDLLLKRQNRKIACQQNDQLFINVAKKFPNAFKLLLLIEQKSKQAQTIDIDQIYIIIDEYDRQNPQLLFQQKQQQIISFLQVLQLRQSQIFDKINLINMNESMIQEKMKLNKVGIKFLIRFMYRNMEYQENWFKIHTQTFRKTQLLHNHLLKIFDKYKINDTITLNQFNLTNKLKIQLNFILSNYESKSYDIFNSSNKGQAKLIDLIVSSITIPIQFGPQPIQLKQLQAQQKINILLNKKNHKMVSNNIQNLYWSNYGSNPSPFNLIQGQQQQQICISFDLTHINPQRQGQNQRQSLRSSKDSIKNKIEQTQNLKTIDLLSMWWTKSKKLTPEMKQILFGAIFQSPFLEYYYFVQNNSYEHLLKKRELRFLVDISNKKQQQLSKSEVISSIVSSQQQNILGVIKINLKLGLLQSVEGIYMSSACEMKVHGLQNYLSDGVTYKMARPTAKLKIFLYKLSEQSLDVFQMSIQLSQKPLSSSYLKFKLIDTDKIQITSSLNQQQVVKFQLIHNRIDYLECKTCKRCTLVSKQQACIFCTEPKEKRGHLNMYLLAHFSYKQEFQEHKSKIIEEVRQSIILSQIKEPLKDQSSFFNMCCCFCQAKQDSLPIQK